MNENLTHLGRELHRRYDEFGAILVLDDGNKRYLSFGTADEQSAQLNSNPIQLQHEYARAMVAVLCQYEAPLALQHITLLGVGGGTLATTLHHVLPQAEINAVDVRAAVILIAHQYFHLPRDKRLITHTSDAYHFLQQATPQQAQLIICDLYQAEGLDPLVLQADFLNLCAQHLHLDGWLVINLWKEHREQLDSINHLKSLFPTLLHCTTHDGNWILWASRSTKVALKTEAHQRSTALAPLLTFNPWNAVKGFYRHS